MSILAWSEELAVSIPLIDLEHRKLFDLLGKLHDAIVIGCSRTTLNTIVTELLNAAEKHFEDEEALMREHHYPGFASHVGEHEKIAKGVKTLVGALAAGKLADKPDIALLPAQWLYSHIRSHDKLYVSFLTQAISAKEQETKKVALVAESSAA